MQVFQLQHHIGKQHFVALGVSVHLQQSDRIDRSQPNAADHLVPHLLDAVFHVPERLQDLPAPVVVNLPGGRQLEGALGAVDQAATQPLFEHVNCLAGGRLRHFILDCSLGKTAVRDHVTKDFDIP